MTIVIVAPVPSKHLKSAMDVAADGRSFAFGSNKLGVFTDESGHLKVVPGTRVLLYGSSTSYDSNGWYRPGFATAEAVFVGWERSETGYYEGQATRPVTTLEDTPEKDTPFVGFWIVERLVAIEKGYSLSALRLNASGRKMSLPPRYPMIVNLPG